MQKVLKSTNVALAGNVLRIYEVRLNEISNYKQMLVGVSCIYAVIGSKNYEAMGLTVSQLRQKLKGLDGKLPVYISDHDHGTFETNGKLGNVNKLNQEDMDDLDKNSLDDVFKIKGTYVSLRVG